MICPACGFDNIAGEDECDRCGTPLTGSDRLAPHTRFDARLSGLASQAPLMVARDTPMSEALESMRDEAVDALLVVDRGRLVGIFTERDALLKLAGRRLAGLTVGDVMTRDPVVLRRDDTVAVAINKMAVGGFRHIPLVELGRPTGIVTARDVFHRIAEIVG
ncbi:MAG: CBS domain-containing protein [Chloroflexi bacterium]|nr:CBS domain-containing protein [Chloroflexota bacterium]